MIGYIVKENEVIIGLGYPTVHEIIFTLDGDYVLIKMYINFLPVSFNEWDNSEAAKVLDSVILYVSDEVTRYLRKTTDKNFLLNFINNQVDHIRSIAKGMR